MHQLTKKYTFLYLIACIILFTCTLISCSKTKGELDPNASPRYASSVSGCACSVLVYSSNNCGGNPISPPLNQSCDIVVPDPFTRINYHCKITNTPSGLVVTDSMITPASYSFTNGASSAINVYETNYSDFPTQAATQLNCSSNYSVAPKFFQSDSETNSPIPQCFAPCTYPTNIDSSLSAYSSSLASAISSPAPDPTPTHTSWSGYSNVTGPGGVGATLFAQWVSQYYTQYNAFKAAITTINNLYTTGHPTGGSPSIFSPGPGFQYPADRLTLKNDPNFQSSLAQLSNTYTQIETLTEKIAVALGETSHLNLTLSVPYFSNGSNTEAGELYFQAEKLVLLLLAALGDLGPTYDPQVISSSTTYPSNNHTTFIKAISQAVPILCSKTITFVNSSTIDLNLTPQTPSSTVTLNQVTGAASISSMVSRLQGIGCLVGTQPVGLSVGSSAILNGLVYEQTTPSTTNRLFFTSNAGVIQGKLCTSPSGAPSTTGPVNLTPDIADPNKISFQINGSGPTYTFNLNNNNNQRLIPTTVTDDTSNTYTFLKVVTSSITNCSQVQ